MLRITSSAVTHQGLVRSANQDSVLVADRLVAVADGLGGHAAGEVASRIAVDRMRELEWLVDPAPDDVLAAVADTNRLINEHAASHPGEAGMGTTLTGVGIVTVDGVETCIVFNVGDSRVYQFADGELGRLTVDHSEVQELQDAGALTPEDAARYPRRNVITRCLGSDPAPAADIWVFPPRPGARYLVCSDGLTGEVDDPMIREVLAGEQAPGAAVATLLDLALGQGGHDNISIVLATVDES